MACPRLVTCIFIAFALIATQPALAQAQDAEKQAAVDRYLSAVPMSKMMDDTYTELAKQIPAEKRAQFITDMRNVLQIQKIEAIARAAMVKVFTVEELNALADFYSSKAGVSAMSKFGLYMGEVMPALMEEVQRAAQEIKSKAAQ